MADQPGKISSITKKDAPFVLAYLCVLGAIMYGLLNADKLLPLLPAG